MAALAIAVVPGGRALESRVLFPAREVAAPAPPPDLTPITTKAADGVTVHALALEGDPDAPVVVVFHNNRETAAHSAPLARALRQRLRFGALLVEYRGYGASRGDGSPDEAGLYADAEAALAWLAARGVTRDRVVLWGHSLGTGVAAEMARRGRGAALVLLAPYTSIDRLVTGVVPFAPARLLVADRFDTLDKARDLRVPTLIVHGDADAIVPFAMGETLARAIPGARFLRVDGGGHADLLTRAGDRVLREVATLTDVAR